MWLHMFCRLYLSWLWAHSSLQLLIQPWICAPGTHYGWVDRGSVEYEVCLTLLNMASTGNGTPDLLISSPMPCPYAPNYDKKINISLATSFLAELLWCTSLLFGQVANEEQLKTNPWPHPISFPSCRIFQYMRTFFLLFWIKIIPVTSLPLSHSFPCKTPL